MIRGLKGDREKCVVGEIPGILGPSLRERPPPGVRVQDVAAAKGCHAGGKGPGPDMPQFECVPRRRF